MRTTEARILFATVGTWGDLLPFVELGRRLKSRGHEVTIACSAGMHSWVQKAGLRAVPFDGDFGKEKAQRHARNWDHWKRDEAQYSDFAYAAFTAQLERNVRALTEFAKDADLLITPTNCPEGRLAHEVSGISWVSVIFMPEEGLRPSAAADARWMQSLNEAGRSLGLKRPISDFLSFKRSDPTLFACSRAFGSAEDRRVLQTGFWFYEDPAWQQWQPDERLRRFMNGEPPLVLSFSSLPLENPAEVLSLHIHAARLVGRRLVVQQGWSGFSSEQLPSGIGEDEVYMADFLPHDWFFSRSAGLITHGGAGTLGRALRNGCPVLVEPYGNDQFFNAMLIKSHGYGTAVHPHRLTAEGLARAIREKLLTPGTRERARAAAAIIRKEDGLESASEAIQNYLREEAFAG